MVEKPMVGRLITEDPRFGGRGRPSFLVSGRFCLRRFVMSSVRDLLPRARPMRREAPRDAVIGPGAVAGYGTSRGG
jgi:hypothetical protein